MKEPKPDQERNPVILFFRGASGILASRPVLILVLIYLAYALHQAEKLTPEQRLQYKENERRLELIEKEQQAQNTRNQKKQVIYFLRSFADMMEKEINNE